MINQIEKFIAIDSQKKDHQFSQEELGFWSNDPPDQVIVATGSIRKALMLVAQMDNFSFKVIENEKNVLITEPMELLEYFKKNILNGNGALKEKTFLGYLFGVELYAEPSDGETDSNENPYKEAVNKVMDFYEKYEGQRILVVSTDTVDMPNLSDLPLGKPENESDFPNRVSFETGGNFDEDSYNQSVADYLEVYKQKFYVVSSEIIHTNAVAILNALTGEIIELEEKILELRIEIDQEKLKKIRADRDMGGGGMTQQLINYDDAEIVRDYFSEFAQGVLPRQEMAIKMALFCQISGMPYAIIELIRLAQQEVIKKE